MRCYILGWLAESAPENEWPVYNTELKTFTEGKLKVTPVSHPHYKIFVRHLATTLNNIGFQKDRIGEVSSALEFYGKSLKLQRAIGNKQGAATSLSNMGTIYANQGNIPKALDAYEGSLKLREEIGDKQDIANSINKIGGIYNNQGDLTKALEYFTRSLKIREEIGDKKGIAYSLNNVGIIYKDLGNHDKALEYYLESARLFEEISLKRGLGLVFNNIGIIYKIKGDLPKAREAFTKSLDFRIETADKNGMAYAYGNLGEIFLKEKNYAKASEYASKAMQYANELGFPEAIGASAELLYKIAKANNDTKTALLYHELYVTMHDSIKNEATRKSSVRSQLKYEYDKKLATDSVQHAKESEIRKVQIAKQESELKAKKKEQTALYGGLGLVLVFAGFMYNRFRLTQKQKQIIELQKRMVEGKQKEILDSIHYAQRIQKALITSEKYIERSFSKLKKDKNLQQ
jgi:tetratricopeptide (TPR) repeat protein